jgi:hypothetical protein
VPQFCQSLQFFYDENEIRANTIQTRERDVKRSDPLRYGDTVFVDNDEVGLVVEKMLSDYKGRDLILVGFDMYTEFKWISEISERSPSFTSAIANWMDLEGMGVERCGDKNLRITLKGTLKAMQIEDCRSGSYFAANDAVRCLAVLSGLIPGKPFTFPVGSFTMPSGITLLYKIPPRRKYGLHTKYPYAARIIVVDDSMLPKEYQTPHSLAKLFAKYELRAVGLNCQKYRVGSKGVKVWWLSFLTRESLDEITREVDGSVLNGKELRVVKFS